MSQKSDNFGKERQAEFGRYLRSLREHRHLRLSHVADDLHINLWEIEHGDRPTSVDLLKRLADKYKVPLEEILAMKYSPQLPLLTGIVRPTRLSEDLLAELSPGELEEVTRYTAFLLLKRAIANGQANSA